MTNHSAETDAKIDAATQALRVDLLPWQMEWLRATLSGRQIVMHRGRRSGWTTVQRVARQVYSTERTSTSAHPRGEP